jgi:hypothetical protein
MGFEIHEFHFQKFPYEYLEIELPIPLPEAEKVFWDNTSFGAVMPNANIRADVECSASVGIFPVWYEDETVGKP